MSSQLFSNLENLFFILSSCLPISSETGQKTSLSVTAQMWLPAGFWTHTHTHTHTHSLLNSGPIFSILNLINSTAQPLQANIPCYRETKVALLSLFTRYPLNSCCRTEMREPTAQCSLSDRSILCFNWFVSPERKLRSTGSSVCSVCR